MSPIILNANNLLDTVLKIVGSRATLLFRKVHLFWSQAEGTMFKTHLDFQIICIGTSIHLTQAEPELCLRGVIHLGGCSINQVNH